MERSVKPTGSLTLEEAIVVLEKSFEGDGACAVSRQEIAEQALSAYKALTERLSVCGMKASVAGDAETAQLIEDSLFGAGVAGNVEIAELAILGVEASRRGEISLRG